MNFGVDMTNTYSYGYNRLNSSSSSCPSSSDDEYGYCEFMSGEDLLNNLDIGDLFVPDIPTEDSIGYISELFLENNTNDTHENYFSDSNCLSFPIVTVLQDSLL